MARIKTNTQNNTKHVEHQDATGIQKKNFCVFRVFRFYFIFVYNFFKDFTIKCG